MPITRNLIHTRTEAKYLIVSLHDLYPGSFSLYKEFYEEIKKLGVERSSILVVPEMHFVHDLRAHQRLMDWIKELYLMGNDICLHGYYHKTKTISGGLIDWLIGTIYTNYEGEFYGLSYMEAKERIERGLKIFTSIGISVVGFTPPAWLISKDAIRAVKDSGLSYLTTLRGVIKLKTGEFLRIPVLVLSSRTIYRRVISLQFLRLYYYLIYKVPLLRLAIHPVDLTHKESREFLLKLIKRLISKRKPITYRDLL